MNIIFTNDDCIRISYNKYSERDLIDDYYEFKYGSYMEIILEDYITLIDDIKKGNEFSLGQLQVTKERIRLGLDMFLPISSDTGYAEMVTDFRKQLGECLEDILFYETP